MRKTFGPKRWYECRCSAFSTGIPSNLDIVAGRVLIGNGGRSRLVRKGDHEWGGRMGEAREVMDRVTRAMTSGNPESLADCYAANVVGAAPDRGELTGRDAVCAYLTEFVEAFPDFFYEADHQYESGSTAIDEGFFGGTNTGDMSGPSGEVIPATGKKVRTRGVDIAEVENGRITSHRFYFDQMDLLGQLGLLPES